MMKNRLLHHPKEGQIPLSQTAQPSRIELQCLVPAKAKGRSVPHQTKKTARIIKRKKTVNTHLWRPLSMLHLYQDVMCQSRIERKRMEIFLTSRYKRKAWKSNTLLHSSHPGPGMGRLQFTIERFVVSVQGLVFTPVKWCTNSSNGLSKSSLLSLISSSKNQLVMERRSWVNLQLQVAGNQVTHRRPPTQLHLRPRVRQSLNAKQSIKRKHNHPSHTSYYPQNRSFSYAIARIIARFQSTSISSTRNAMPVLQVVYKHLTT